MSVKGKYRHYFPWLLIKAPAYLGTMVETEEQIAGRLLHQELSVLTKGTKMASQATRHYHTYLVNFGLGSSLLTSPSA